MSVVAIVQARMGSTRLPGKVLEEIAGRPAIWHTMFRTSLAVPRTVLAIPDTADNDILFERAQGYGWEVYRGPEHDVLKRYAIVAEATDADIVVRITGDCPLVHPPLVRHVITASLATGYASNFHLVRTYPKGMDCEAMDVRALLAADIETTAPYDREHVTPGIQRFYGGRCIMLGKHPEWRWTLDTPKDLEFFRAVADRIYLTCATYETITALLEREPELAKINT